MKAPGAQPDAAGGVQQLLPTALREQDARVPPGWAQVQARHARMATNTTKRAMHVKREQQVLARPALAEECGREAFCDPLLELLWPEHDELLPAGGERGDARLDRERDNVVDAFAVLALTFRHAGAGLTCR